MLFRSPHRYTRTLALGPDFPPAFRGAARVLLLPVYAASEPPSPGGASEDLLRLFRADPDAPPADFCPDFPTALRLLPTLWQPGDWVLLVGAGDIENLASPLRTLLEESPSP